VMRVGYARVSTTEQNIDAQLERLADCEKIFAEKRTGSLVERPELAAALEYVREGDTLVATRLDRLARSVSHLCSMAETLRRKGVELEILDQAIDTRTPTGKLLFHMLAAIAEFELTIRKEQQRAGIAYARAAGKPTGRQAKLKDVAWTTLDSMRAGGFTFGQIADRFDVSERTVRRALAGEGCYGPPTGNRIVPTDLPHEFSA